MANYESVGRWGQRTSNADAPCSSCRGRRSTRWHRTPSGLHSHLSELWSGVVVNEANGHQSVYNQCQSRQPCTVHNGVLSAPLDWPQWCSPFRLPHSAVEYRGSSDSFAFPTWRVPWVGKSGPTAAAANALTLPDLEDRGARDEDRDAHPVRLDVAIAVGVANCVNREREVPAGYNVRLWTQKDQVSMCSSAPRMFRVPLHLLCQPQRKSPGGWALGRPRRRATLTWRFKGAHVAAQNAPEAAGAGDRVEGVTYYNTDSVRAEVASGAMPASVARSVMHIRTQSALVSPCRSPQLKLKASLRRTLGFSCRVPRAGNGGRRRQGARRVRGGAGSSQCPKS